MTTWILILVIYGPEARAATNVPGFTLKAECEAAGRAVESKLNGLFRNAEFVCVQQTRGAPGEERPET